MIKDFDEFLPFAHPTINADMIEAVADVLNSGWISSGPKVKEFENKLSSRFRGRFVRTVNNATAGLGLAMRICGIGDGDEVITTPFSWVGTANAILAVGAKPVFVDVNYKTRLINLESIKDKVTERTKAIVPVDIAGHTVDRSVLYKIANRFNLRVIEDAAQSFGSLSRGFEIGKSGDITVFSFHANKNLAMGEGGAVVMNEEYEADLFEKLRFQGIAHDENDDFEVEVLGGKFNLNDIAAGLGLEQLKYIEKFNLKRRRLAESYFKNLNFLNSISPGILPSPEFITSSNWHMFQILLPPEINRQNFIDDMKERFKIGIGKHYPAIHLFKLYRKIGYKEGDFPITEDISRRIVTLPLFPLMEDKHVIKVSNAIRKLI